MTTASEEMNAKRREYEKEIRETCELAGRPERAQAFISRNATAVEVRGELLGNRFDIVADMKRRHGVI